MSYHWKIHFTWIDAFLISGLDVSHFVQALPSSSLKNVQQQELILQLSNTNPCLRVTKSQLAENGERQTVKWPEKGKCSESVKMIATEILRKRHTVSSVGARKSLEKHQNWETVQAMTENFHFSLQKLSLTVNSFSRQTKTTSKHKFQKRATFAIKSHPLLKELHPQFFFTKRMSLPCDLTIV